MSSVTTPIQHLVETPRNAIRQEEEVKHIQIAKEEIKLSLLTGGMIICVESPKESIKKKKLLGTNKLLSQSFRIQS